MIPRWLNGKKKKKKNTHTKTKKSAYQCRRCRGCGFNLWVREIPWSRKWQPTPVFLPGKFPGQRGLAGYSPWGHKEWDTTEDPSTQRARAHTPSPSLTQSLTLSPPWTPTPDTAVGKQWGPGGGETQAGLESQVATHIQTSWALSWLYHISSSQKGPSIIPHKMPAHPLIIHLYLKWSNFQSLCFLSFKLQLSHLLSFNQ